MSSPIAARASRALTVARAMDRPLALLAAMAFISQIGVSIMLPLLPLYALSLGASPFVLGLLVSLFGLALAIGQLSAGFLTDRFAARRLVAAGIGVYAVANAAIAIASSAVPLLVFRVIAGLGSGVNIVAERLYLVRMTSRARLAAANGMLSAAGSAGMVAGPSIGGLLAAAGDLRLPFFAVAITSAIVTIGAFFLPAEQAGPRAGEPRSPEPGPAAIEPALAGPDPELPIPSAIAAAALDRSARRRFVEALDRRLVSLFLVQLAFQATFGAFISTYAPFADERLGWSTAEIGLVFSLFGLGSVLFGPPLAGLADRHGRRRIGLLGCLLIIPFAIVYAAELPRLVLYPVTIVAGAGLTALEASWYALLGEATDGGRRGRAFGTIVALSSLGMIVGSTIATQLWERTGDVGLGMLVASLMIGVAALALATHPADRPDRPVLAAAGAA